MTLVTSCMKWKTTEMVIYQKLYKKVYIKYQRLHNKQGQPKLERTNQKIFIEQNHYSNSISNKIYKFASMIKQYDQLVKLILIGGSGVGKSSLLMQFAENKFTQNYLTTIGVDFRFKTVKSEGKNIKFQIWDTAGQERFRTITSAYYKGADGIIMVYDLTDPASIDDLQNFWISEAYNYCDKNIKVLLLGNKLDCQRVVSADRIKKIAEKYHYLTQEVSAKTGEKVQDVIKDFGVGIARTKMQKLGLIGPSSTSTPVVSGNSGNNNDQKKSAKDESSRSSSSSTPEPTKTIQITSKPKKGPAYQKKCC